MTRRLVSLVRYLIAIVCGAVFGWNAASAPADEPLRIIRSRETAGFYCGARQLMEYRFIESPRKPYVSKLYSPSGAQILLDSPSDHKHHHALMFALSADKVNFWEENEAAMGMERQISPGKARQVSRKGTRSLRFTHELEWVDVSSGKPLIIERREIAAYRANNLPATLMTWHSRLLPAPGRQSVELGGAHFVGLGLRFVRSMDAEGQFFNSEGKPGEIVRGTERLTPARWAAYSAVADGKPVTVGVFDHPSNPRHPSRMFTMSAPFAYIAATLNLWKEPWTLAAGKPLGLAYGVAVWDGRIDSKQVEDLYRKWLELASEALNK